MASFISSPAVLTSTTRSLHSSSNSYNGTLKFSPSPLNPHLGFTHFSTWTGLKHMGLSITTISLDKEKKCRPKGRMVFASLFGVGAPEALVIGVVALLVFGPKGLAEVARNLGKTLRAFQPTIRELQDVSREFKNTLEREISLDDIPSQTQNTYTSNQANSVSKSQTEADPDGAHSRAYTAEDYLRITEEQLKNAAIQPQGSTPTTSIDTQSTANGATATPPQQKPEK